MSLEIDPTEGVFNASGERKTFTIINVTKERLAFKVKTSDVDLYRAKQVYGFVAPQEKFELIIQRMEGPAKLDKIVVQYAEVPEQEVEPKAPFQAEAQSDEVILPVNAKS